MPLRFPALKHFIMFLLLVMAPRAFAQSEPAQNLVGFWWKPSESGWGLTIQQQGTSTFAVWFTYDAQGAAVWYTLQCTFSGSACAGDLHTGSGTPYWQITGGANTVLARVGTGVITTTGTNRLSLSYSIGSVTQTKTNLEPQNFAAASLVPFCSLQALPGANPRAGLTNYTDHWWGGPNASGWGVQVSHQGNQVFAGWYSYNAQGTASWMVAIGTQDVADGRRFTGTLYVVDPGIPFSAINGPVLPSSVTPSGTFELSFTDGERGTFTWAIRVPALGPELVVRSLAIERFAIAGGALNVCTVEKPGETSGRVVASQDPTTPVAGARLVNRLTGAVLAITDAAGDFLIPATSNAGDPPLSVSISADGYLTRETGLQPGTQGVVADIIKLSSPFSLKYYRELVRFSNNGDVAPGSPLTGWRIERLNVYIRTNLLDPTDTTREPVDTGVAVPEEAVNRALGGLQKTIAQLAGGTIQLERVEMGPGPAHERESGWLGVSFFHRESHPQNYAGLAMHEFNGYSAVRLGVHASASIDCAPMTQGLAMHEFGHLFGLSHAQLDSPNVMAGGGVNMPCANANFSPAERLHARIAFSRPRGNEDPDRDPVGYVLPGFGGRSHKP